MGEKEEQTYILRMYVTNNYGQKDNDDEVVAAAGDSGWQILHILS